MASSAPPEPVLPSLPQLVAHYLQASGYEASLAAFLEDASIADFADLPRPSVDLRDLVEEYNVEKLRNAMLLLKVTEGPQDEEEILKREIDVESIPKKVFRTLGDVHMANILTVAPHTVPVRTFDTSTASYTARHRPSLLTTSADKTLKITDLETGEVEAIFDHHKAAILSVSAHPTLPRLLLTGSMDGTAKLLDVITREVLQTFPHQKFVVKTAFSLPTGKWLATASYDRTIKLYSLVPSPTASSSSDDAEEDEDDLAKDVTDRWELRKVVETKSNPEGLLFGPSEEGEGAWLAFTTREDHHLKYILLPSIPKPTSSPDTTEPPFEIQRFNLNPNGDDHVSFSILDLALHPGGKHIALLTGNHAGSGATSRVFLYSFLDGERKKTIWTGASCDQFSSPRMAWLPDGSAVAVTSDDGIVRVVDLGGRVRAMIPAHGVHPQTGVRSEMVRDICVVPGEAEGEVQVVSCGFDQTVRIMG